MSLTRLPSISISPPSAARKPATKLSNVVLPHPDGPSRVMSSPWRMDSVASFRAEISPKLLLAPARRTATLPGSGVASAPAYPSDRCSAARLDIQHFPEAEIGIGHRQ